MTVPFYLPFCSYFLVGSQSHHHQGDMPLASRALAAWVQNHNGCKDQGLVFRFQSLTWTLFFTVSGFEIEP